ncbi:oligosaccharide flippase family protein [Clostridium sp.]|uniref:oligosaccharide flippase family protein n=1 Tax=Clostridium sp. TaxID=1506 RepID=UPI0039A23528
MSIKKNFIYNFSYQILTMILPLITTPYIARVIGPEGVGVQSYTLSIANYFVLFAMLGINNHGNRSIAMVRGNKEKLNKTFISIYFVQFTMSILMILIYLIYIIFIAKENKVIFIIQAIYIISALLDINWFFFGMEQFKLTVVRNIVIKLASVVSIFIFVRNSNDLYLYSLILALGTLISQCILWKYLNKYISFVKVSKEEILVQVKPILILFIPVIAVSIYKIMDKIMLGSMSSMTQVGFFENSEKIMNIPLGVITALGTVMLPKMSNLYAIGNEKEGNKYIGLSLEFVMFISVGAMFGLIGVSPILIPIFLGDKFIECINIVSIMSITIVFLAWANVVRTQYLIPKKKDKIYIISTIIGAIINLLMNLLLIKKYGAVGATIGTIFAESSVCIYQSIMVRKELNMSLYLKKVLFYMAPGIIMCVVIRILGNTLGVSILTGSIQIIVGGTIYVVLSLIYMILIKNEIMINTIKKFKHI